MIFKSKDKKYIYFIDRIYYVHIHTIYDLHSFDDIIVKTKMFYVDKCTYVINYEHLNIG